MSFPLLKTSRPRFWFYLVGPFLLGITGGLAFPSLELRPLIFSLLWLGWFTFPANIFLYGVNDLYDEDTDALNPKKSGYETRITTQIQSRLERTIWLSVILGWTIWFAQLFFLPSHTLWISGGFIGFLVFGHQYSALPIRAKTKPFLDSLFNILYLFPALIGWGLSGSTTSFPWLLFLAGSLWCIAMHAFSAIPDIEADRNAQLQTIATALGRKKTFLLCALLYSAACAIAYPWIQWLSLVGITLYLLLLIAAWRRRQVAKDLFFIYKLFPFVNIGLGFALWIMSVYRWR